MAGVSDKQLLPIGPFPAGVDNLNKETSLTRSDDGSRVAALREGVNIDLPRSGWPQRRQGYGLLEACTRGHSLWAGGRFPYMLYADGATQYARNTGGAPFVVRAGLAPREISYCVPNDRVYCSNGTQAWSVLADGSAAAWGVETPAGQPAIAVSANGGLHAGKYQVAITFLDLFGEESGTGLAAVIDVPEGEGIALTHIAQPLSGDVVRVRVYLSPTNGDTLFQFRDLPVGQTSAVLGVGTLGRQLSTQFLDPMLPGQIVRYLGGRIYVARGNEQRWTESLRYGLTNRVKNVRRIGERITLMEPVGDGGDSPGLFVSDQKRTYWLGGADPSAQTMRIAYSYGAVPGTGATVPASMFGLETTLPCAYWIAKNGVACLGLPGGQVVPLREKQVVAPNATSGASLFREQNGIRQMITTLAGASAQGLAIGDRASAKVFRNGIEI